MRMRTRTTVAMIEIKEVILVTIPVITLLTIMPEYNKNGYNICLHEPRQILLEGALVCLLHLKQG
jgi:hypothetical protein